MKTTISILNRYDNSILFSYETEDNSIMVALLEAIKRGADLRGTDLRGADLRRADLSGANLSGANLDFSCLPLWCGSLKTITDEKQRIQICFHLLSLIQHGQDVTDFEKSLLEFAKDYANNFHRTEVPRIL